MSQIVIRLRYKTKGDVLYASGISVPIHFFSCLSNFRAVGSIFSCFQTLQSMLTSVKKGKPINEDEIPPPVATGGKPSAAPQAEPIREQEKPAPANTPPQTANVKPVLDARPVVPSKPQLLQPPSQRPMAVTPDTLAISPLTPSQPNTQHSGTHTLCQALISLLLWCCYSTYSHICVCVCFRAQSEYIKQTERV